FEDAVAMPAVKTATKMGATKNNTVLIGNGTSAREFGKCARRTASTYLLQLTIKNGNANTARIELARNVKSRAPVTDKGLIPCIRPGAGLAQAWWRPAADPSRLV